MLTEAQLEKRRSGIGSSEIAAVVGESPWNNAHGIWLEKRGLADPKPMTDAMWLGTEMEPIIAKRYSQEMAAEVVPGPGTIAHPDYPWIMATTDYERADGSRIIECKWVGARTMHHWTMDADGAPVYVNLQKQQQMFVRGIDRADAAVIFGATAEFRVYEFRRDDAIIEALLKIATRFWGMVQRGEPPPVDETEQARQVLLKLYPRNRAPLKQAPPEAAQWFERHQAAGAEIDRWTAEEKLAANHLRKIIGDADGIEGEFGCATWRSDKHGKRVLRTYPRKESAA